MGAAQEQTVGGVVAANLRKWRAEAGLTQREVAERAGLHRTEISLLERGGREPRLSTLVVVARALGVATNDLTAGVDEMSARPRRNKRRP